MKKIPVMKQFFTEDEISNISQVIESGWVAQGPKVAEFESEVASHEGVNYGVATTSCTTALHLALLAFGISGGDDVIIPSFTFIATPNAVVYTGAVPIFADIEPDTYNISSSSVSNIIEKLYVWDKYDKILINRKTGNRLKCIIPVHLFGLCADMYKINEISKEYNLLTLEDSACALGAKINDIHQGAFGNPSCLSFHPRKSITTGEGGMILTSDKMFADRVSTLRSHGASVSELNRHKFGGYLLHEFNELGYNYRMTDIQAAVGIAQMKKFDWLIEERRKRAKKYCDLLKKINWLAQPVEPNGYFHTFQSYVCMLKPEELGFNTVEETSEFRNKIMQALEDKGISTRQGTHAVHTLGYYKERFSFTNDACPVAYKADRLSITLPLYVQISEEDQKYVIDVMCEIKDDIK